MSCTKPFVQIEAFNKLLGVKKGHTEGGKPFSSNNPTYLFVYQ